MNPMMQIKKIALSFYFAGKGLLAALRTDHSFRLEVVLGAPIFTVSAWFLRPMTSVEVILLWGSYLLILIVELLNTAIERLLERLHPEKHELIAIAKDIAAGAVLIAFIFAALVVGTLLWSRFGAEPLIEFVRMV
jgi:diacylglycerol kinase (ATP)